MKSRGVLLRLNLRRPIQYANNTQWRSSQQFNLAYINSKRIGIYLLGCFTHAVVVNLSNQRSYILEMLQNVYDNYVLRATSVYCKKSMFLLAEFCAGEGSRVFWCKCIVTIIVAVLAVFRNATPSFAVTQYYKTKCCWFFFPKILI